MNCGLRFILPIFRKEYFKLIMLNIRPNEINSHRISRISLQYMSDTFDNWRSSMNDDQDYNYLDYIYMITYFSETPDPLTLMEHFRKKNTSLMNDITRNKCSFYDYVRYQHAGIYFVDCKGSRYDYVPNMLGLHIHCIVIVHPEWRDHFTEVFQGAEKARLNALELEEWVEELGRAPKNGLLLKKVKPTESDALRAISYSAKAVIGNNGIFPDRQDLFGMIGPRKIQKEKRILIKNEKKIVHSVSPESLTPRSSSIIQKGCTV